MKIVYQPTTFFHKLKERPQWLFAFLAINLLQIIFTIFPALFKSEGLSIASPLFWLRYSPAVFIPISNLVAWIFSASIVYFLIVIFGKNLTQFRFKNIFAVIVYSNVVILFASIASLIVGLAQWLLGVAPTFSEARLVGLDTLLKGLSLPAMAVQFAEKINIFTVWYLGLLTIGVSLTTGITRLMSGFFVVSVWLFGMGLQLSLRTIVLDYVKSFGG